MYQNYEFPKQNKEYKYRCHELASGKWQIERAEIAPYQKFIHSGQYEHWEYFMTADSKQEADKLVHQASQKPTYHYY